MIRKRLQSFSWEKRRRAIWRARLEVSWYFKFWVCSDLKELSLQGGRFPTVRSLVQLIEGILFLICSKVFIRAAHEVITFEPQLQLESGTEVTILEGANITPARFDASRDTAVTCFNYNSTDKAGEHLPTLYHDSSASFFSKAYNQLNGCIGMSVKMWCAG